MFGAAQVRPLNLIAAILPACAQLLGIGVFVRILVAGFLLVSLLPTRPLGPHPDQTKGRGGCLFAKLETCLGRDKAHGEGYAAPFFAF